MFEATDIREWRGHDIVDTEGHKIGELEAISVDTSTDRPALATVRVGMPTHSAPSQLTQIVGQTYQRALRRFGPVDGELLAVALLEEEAGLRLRHGPA